MTRIEGVRVLTVSIPSFVFDIRFPKPCDGRDEFVLGSKVAQVLVIVRVALGNT